MGRQDDSGALLRRLQIAFEHLEGITTLEAMLSLRGTADALYARAKRGKTHRETRFRAAELRVRCEHRLGELLPSSGLHGGDRRSEHHESQPTLADWGLSRSEASHARLIGKMPRDELDTYIAECAAHQREPTLGGVLAAARACVNSPGCREADSLQRFIHELRQFAHDHPDRRFRCILVTPAWGRQVDKRHRSGSEDAGMRWQDVAELPVAELAAADAQVFIWHPSQSLLHFPRVLKRWGCAYQGILCCRTDVGQYIAWCRDEVSVMVVGMWGRLEYRDNSHSNWREVSFREERPADSQLQETLERFSPPPYLHIFGHSARAGWTVLPHSARSRCPIDDRC